jgi:RNA polymerase sigma-70 factor (ECF subfamily)
MNSSDVQLIDRAKQGDLSAFETLIRPFEGRIYNFLKKMCAQCETAEDMMQETFVSAWKNIGSYRQEAKFSTWMFQIATNHCLMQKRKDARRTSISLDAPLGEAGTAWDVPDLSAEPSVQYDNKDLKQRLDHALSQLPEIYRAIFILKDVEGFRSNEISKMLDISLPNVKARVLRARMKLQEILKGQI